MVGNSIVERENANPWDYRHLTVALAIGFLAQSLVLPCLCFLGVAKINFAWAFDALVILRILLARYRRETGNGWMFYAGLCYTSAAWIQGLAYLVFGDT